MRTIFEELGGTYTLQGDYRLPNLTLPPQPAEAYGLWSSRRLQYLKEHHKVLYYNLLTSGKLHAHLADTDKQAQELFSRLIQEYSAEEHLDEQMKAERPLEWVGKMNNIRERATEVVMSEAVCR